MNSQVCVGWARREFEEFGYWVSFEALDWLGCLVQLGRLVQLVVLGRQSGGL